MDQTCDWGWNGGGGNVACSVSPLSCCTLAEAVLPNHETVIVVSLESITILVVWSPAGKVCIVPTQVPVNLLALAGVEADTAREDVFARFICDSTTGFGFGFAACFGAGVGFSSTIGAGKRCAIIKVDNETIRKRSNPVMG